MAFNPATFAAGNIDYAQSLGANAANFGNVLGVSADGGMSDIERDRVIQRIAVKMGTIAGGPFDNAQVAVVIDAMLVYFIHNGTSDKLSPRSTNFVEFTDQGGVNHTVQMHDLLRCCDYQWRRFARCLADRARQIIRSSGGALVSRWGMNNGIPERFNEVAFDFAEYCKEPPLTLEEKRVLAAAKGNATAGSASQGELLEAPLSTKYAAPAQVNAHLHLGGGGPSAGPAQRRLM